MVTRSDSSVGRRRFQFAVRNRARLLLCLLQTVYEASKKTWMAKSKPEDADGSEIATDGRVMEMLSEHTLEGWFEGYVLTGRHGFLSSYEAFVHIIDSMFNQHAKWLEKSKLELRWRAPISSINLLITSLVWRPDPNWCTA